MKNSKELLEWLEGLSFKEFNFEFRISFQEFNDVLSQRGVEMRIVVIPRSLFNTTEIVEQGEFETFKIFHNNQIIFLLIGNFKFLLEVNFFTIQFIT